MSCRHRSFEVARYFALMYPPKSVPNEKRKPKFLLKTFFNTMVIWIAGGPCCSPGVKSQDSTIAILVKAMLLYLRTLKRATEEFIQIFKRISGLPTYCGGVDGVYCQSTTSPNSWFQKYLKKKEKKLGLCIKYRWGIHSRAWRAIARTCRVPALTNT